MKRIFLALLLSFAFITSSNTTVNAEWSYYFEDVEGKNPHYGPIYYLAENGIIKGFELKQYDYYDHEYYITRSASDE